ncbi:MAG: hypothetical protein ACI94Y_004528 [Maribacter sp.]|jgi:hypothetical protein
MFEKYLNKDIGNHSGQQTKVVKAIKNTESYGLMIFYPTEFIKSFLILNSLHQKYVE